MKIYRKIVSVTAVLLLIAVNSFAYDESANENLIVFDAQGEVSATYHIHDLTTQVNSTGGDNYTIEWEDYPGSVTEDPVSDEENITIQDAEAVVPNTLSGTHPAPDSSYPSVSLFGFDDAVYTSTSPTGPGVSFSPSSGTYHQTIAVSIKASPAAALVQYSMDGGTTWTTGENQVELYVYQTSDISIRARNGGTTSGIKLMSYVIERTDGTPSHRIDSDKDGFPDCWEVAKGMNPLANDLTNDTDGDGISDMDELLRGSDPADAAATPLDSDGDGWSDFDESLRGTNPGDATDYPVVDGLYHVERLLSGRFFQDNGKTIPVANIDYAITTLASKIVSEGAANLSGEYGIDDVIRLPAGSPMLIRGVGSDTVIHPNFIIKRYLPFLRALSPDQISSESWTTPEEWEALYIDYLRDNLVVTESDFDITPENIGALSFLERELEIIQGLETGLYILSGSASHAAELITVQQMQSILAARGQTINDHMDDVVSTLSGADTCGFLFSSSIEDIYTIASAGDVKTIEKQVADFFQQETGRYLAGLLLWTSYDAVTVNISALSTDLCQVFDPALDSDGDGVVNQMEVPTHIVPEGASDPFETDSDGDGVGDGTDNCDLTPNADQMDSDGDGYGDACDNDNDNDGLDNGTEMAFGSSQYAEDSDTDGVSDYDEWVAYNMVEFLENSPPAQPAITSPLEGAYDVVTSPEIVAASFSDPDSANGDYHRSSRWEIALDEYFYHPVLVKTTSQMLTALSVPELILEEGATYYARVRYFDRFMKESPWSAPVSFTIAETGMDSGGNGIPDDQEVDGSVDLDGDSVPDPDQPEEIKCVNTVVNNSIQICIKRHTNAALIQAVSSVDPADIAHTSGRPDELPAGLVGFKIETDYVGDTAQVIVYFSLPVQDGTRWFRYDSEAGWEDYSEHTSPGPDTNSLVLELEDGGFGDSDGVENGVIVMTGGIDLPLQGQSNPGDNSGGSGGSSGGGCFINTVEE